MVMKIAVCGSAPSSRLLAPFGDQSWEIWACSPQNYDFPRVDAWFELHSLDRKFVPSNEPYAKRLKKHPRVYISQADARLPNGILFDADTLIAKHGPYFFSSSLAWMMAFALEQKPEMIGVWGVDMSATDEYGYQRAGCHYFMQKIQEAGIQMMLPPQCDLAQPHPLYGFKEHWPMYWKFKESKKELEQRIESATQRENSARDEGLVLKGARNYAEYVTNTWLMDTRPFMMEALPEPEKKPDEAV
jgi:hypothetical protein